MPTRQQGKQTLLVLVGPTAAGKSALALLVAPRVKAEIISVDSAQIYRGLDIGTAKPTTEERCRVPHHLIDLVKPDQNFSVVDYQHLAKKTIAATAARGHLPFLVGGTGLYADAVIKDYAFIARGKNKVLRARLAEQARLKGPAVLHATLQKIDPRAAAAIHPHDQKRIIRALEVYQQEGHSITEQMTLTRQRKSGYKTFIFGLTMPRETLYRRIDRRVEEMMQAGFREEVEQLLESGYSPQCRGLQSLGYRQIVQFLLGETTWSETVLEIQKQTRRLAKRQLTWFRRNPRLQWLQWGGEDRAELEQAAEIICAAIEGKESHINEYTSEDYDWREP